MATFQTSVALGTDDCYTFDTTMRVDKDYIYLDDGSNAFNAYFRFLNVTIPPGSTITDAKLTLTAYGTSSAQPSLRIACIDEDDTATFSTQADADGRDVTSETVDWTPDAWTEHNPYDTPDLANSIQEVIDRGGWASGQALAVKIWILSNDGTKVADSYEKSEGTPAELTVNYNPSSAGQPTMLRATAVPHLRQWHPRVSS